MSECAIIGGECPRTNNRIFKRFCPAWSDGVIWRNTVTGEERVSNCAFEMLVPAVIEIIKASNRPAAAMESARNEIVGILKGLMYASGFKNEIQPIPAIDTD